MEASSSSLQKGTIGNVLPYVLALLGLFSSVLALLSTELPFIPLICLGSVLLAISMVVAKQRYTLLWVLLVVSSLLPWGKVWLLGEPLARKISVQFYLFDVFLFVLITLTLWQLLRGGIRWRFQWLDIALVLMIGAVAVSLYNAPSAEPVIVRLVEWLRIIALFILMRLRLNNELEKNAIITTILAMLIVQGILAVFSAALGSDFGMWEKPGNTITLFEGRNMLFRAGGTVEPNVLSQYCSLWLPLAVVVFIKRLLPRGFAIAAIVGCVIGVLLPLSRSGWLTAVLGVGILLLIWFGRFNHERASWQSSLLVAVVILAAIVGVIWIMGGVSESATTSSQSRLGMSTTALQMWQDHPLLGIGAGAYLDLVLFYDPNPALWAPVHSFYLEVLAETGLLGLSILLMIMVLLTIIPFTKILRTNSTSSMISLALWAGAVCQLLRMSVTMSFHDITVVCNLMLALGMLNALLFNSAEFAEKNLG